MPCNCPVCTILYPPLSLAEAMLNELARFRYHNQEPKPYTPDGKHYLYVAKKLENASLLLKFRAMAETWDIVRLDVEFS